MSLEKIRGKSIIIITRAGQSHFGALGKTCFCVCGSRPYFFLFTYFCQKVDPLKIWRWKVTRKKKKRMIQIKKELLFHNFTTHILTHEEKTVQIDESCTCHWAYVFTAPIINTCSGLWKNGWSYNFYTCHDFAPPHLGVAILRGWRPRQAPS